MDVQMPDPWRYVEGALPEYRYDVHILHPPLDPDDALIQQVGKRGVHDQFGAGSFFISRYGEAPRTAFAL
jgi:hypothetical protein